MKEYWTQVIDSDERLSALEDSLERLLGRTDLAFEGGGSLMLPKKKKLRPPDWQLLSRSMIPFRNNRIWCFYSTFSHTGSLLPMAEALIERFGINDGINVSWFRYLDCGFKKKRGKMLSGPKIPPNWIDDLPYIAILRWPDDKSFGAYVGSSRGGNNYWAGKPAALSRLSEKIRSVKDTESCWGNASVAENGKAIASLDLAASEAFDISALVREAENHVFGGIPFTACDELYVALEGSLGVGEKCNEMKAMVRDAIKDFSGAWSHWKVPKFVLKQEELYEESLNLSGTIFMEEDLDIPLWSGRVLDRQVDLFRIAREGQFRLCLRLRVEGEKARIVIDKLRDLLGVEFVEKSKKIHENHNK